MPAPLTDPNVIMLHLQRSQTVNGLSMGWFRWHRRQWAWAALLALGLQVGMSFGHVHANHADRAALTATTDTGHSAPNTGDDNDYCATCAILAMLAGAQTATAPAVVLPVALASSEIIVPGQTPHIASRHVAFRSRAPPQS